MVDVARISRDEWLSVLDKVERNKRAILFLAIKDDLQVELNEILES